MCSTSGLASDRKWSEINEFGSENGMILPFFFYISGRRSNPEVEHVILDIQYNDYLRV